MKTGQEPSWLNEQGRMAMVDPAWLAWAKTKLGVHEIPGPGDNSEIVSWFKFTSLPRSDWHDSTMWCSVFANAAFALTGFKGTGSALAMSWAKWGKEVEWEDAVPGDVVVFEWTNADGDVTGHHVAFYLRHEGNRVRCLGGNQGGAAAFGGEVDEKWFSMDDVVAVRAAS